MERNIPRDASESIDFYLRTIYSVLRSKSDTRISVFEEAHSGMDSMMHPDARSDFPDYNAFIYSILRLPECLIKVQRIILGQNIKMFAEQGYSDIEKWEVVSARARRRYCLYNNSDTLACFITSRSDIDDLIPEITAFQIEWNKFHYLLMKVPDEYLKNIDPKNETEYRFIAEAILSPVEDLNRLYTIWGKKTGTWLLEMKSRVSELRVKLLDSSSIQYSRSANSWMKNILQEMPDIVDRPIYFVSSNTHSITNMISGYALSKESELIDFLKKMDDQSLFHEWDLISRNKLSAKKENLLYYVLKKYQQTPAGAYTVKEQQEIENEGGIFRISGYNTFDIETQIIELSKINTENIDPRIKLDNIEKLKKSEAILFNIDYPLGMTAFNVMTKFAEEFEDVRGIYIMGKAASLNGIYGDVIIPTAVHDIHSQNTYLFQNCFTASDIEPWLVYGSILDNQRAVSVFGTFLQNHRFVETLYQGGYTDIEMEAGPYLSAIYEMVRPDRHPTNEFITLYNNRFDLGILHYVSDTPMSKGKNLGAGTLSYFGMDSTYATSIAILRRIFTIESHFIK
ncbi:MAG TPA: hypothetical protein PKJ76_01795 [Flexilinea sp.]|nr:hypothetical protein [Flexilinea sp.]HPS47445.1 hypothetical protein [Flexilinea sp.]